MKAKRFLLTAAIAAMCAITSMAFVACGDDDADDTDTPTSTSTTTDDTTDTSSTTDTGSTETTVTAYTASFNSMDDLADNYGENPMSVQANGGTNGAGLIALDNWGAKKFLTDDDGEIAGTGLAYTLTITIEEDDYTFELDAHVIGNEESGGYSGEGDVIYTWQGAATETTGGYTLAAPTYATFEVTGTITADDPTASTSFVPTAPYSMTSEDSGTTAGNSRVVADYLIYIMYGTTVSVSGSSISSFADSAYFTDWTSLS